DAHCGRTGACESASCARRRCRHRSQYLGTCSRGLRGRRARTLASVLRRVTARGSSGTRADRNHSGQLVRSRSAPRALLADRLLGSDQSLSRCRRPARPVRVCRALAANGWFVVAECLPCRARLRTCATGSRTITARLEHRIHAQGSRPGAARPATFRAVRRVGVCLRKIAPAARALAPDQLVRKLVTRFQLLPRQARFGADGATLAPLPQAFVESAGPPRDPRALEVNTRR